VKFITTILAMILSLNAFSLAQNRKGKSKNNLQMTKEQVAYTLEKAGFPREIVPVVTCLAQYESNFMPNAINRHNTNNTKDHGLLQINDIWMKDCKLNEADLVNPLKNAKCALKIYEKQGLTAWVTYKKFKRICLVYQIPNYNTANIAEIIIKNNQLM
jgi:Lysozyme like domain